MAEITFTVGYGRRYQVVIKNNTDFHVYADPPVLPELWDDMLQALNEKLSFKVIHSQADMLEAVKRHIIAYEEDGRIGMLCEDGPRRQCDEVPVRAIGPTDYLWPYRSRRSGDDPC